MGSVKKRQKTRGVVTQNELDACVERYRELYDLWKVAHRRRVTSRELKAKIRILQQARSIVASIGLFVLGKWIGELLKIGVITPIGAHGLSHAQFPMPLVCIDEAVDYLSTIAKSGRPRNLVLGDCANALAELFKKRTGESRWGKVGD